MAKNRIKNLLNIPKMMSFVLTTTMILGGIPVAFPAKDTVVQAATDKIQIVGTPTVYVQSGGESIVSVQVKNVSNAEIKGVNIAQGYKNVEFGNFTAGSSEHSTVNEFTGSEDSWYRFSAYFEKSGYAAKNAKWNNDEEGYTIAKGATATLWFTVRSREEKPGTYNEWIRFGNVHTDYYAGFVPVKILDEAYSGECAIKVVTYNPSAATVTLGTSTNYGRDISTIALGSTIDFGTIDLAKSTGLEVEKTYYTRNTSAVSSTGDEHGNSQNIKVELDVVNQENDNWEVEYPFSCNSNLMSGMSWSPLEPAPMTANSFTSARTGIKMNVTNYIAGTYNATFRLYTIPHGVKVNGGSAHTNGIYTWPVKVKLTGTNPRIPKAPTNVKVSPGNGQVEVTWNAPSGTPESTTYYVYRRDGAETNENKNNIGNASFNWEDYRWVGQDETDAEGKCLFVDGTVENEKTYTYVILAGKPLKAYPAITSAVKPKASINSKIQAPEDFYATESLDGVKLEWIMNNNYGGDENDASSMVDHFNIYRNNRLVAQVKQNAVIATPYYNWREDPDEPGTWTYGLISTSYNWETFIETPVAYQNYSWNVAAVSKSGVEGYWSETIRRFGMSEDVAIKSHRVRYSNNEYWSEEEGKDVSVPTFEMFFDIFSKDNTVSKVECWKTEGSSVPDITKPPFMTVDARATIYNTATLTDTDIVPGKVYSYTVQATDEEGNKSKKYTFKVKAENIGNQYYTYYNSTDVEYEVIGGTKVKMKWDAELDESGLPMPEYTYKVYRNNTLVKTFTLSKTSNETITYTDEPDKDGVYTYRVDVFFNNMTTRGCDYVFNRDTTAVDESTLLKVPSAPILDVRISERYPVLRWAATNEGGEPEGFHIYRRNAGKMVNGTYVNNNGYSTFWNNMRYITIDNANNTVLSDVEGYYDENDYTKGYLNGVSWLEEDCPCEYWVTAYNQAGESEPSKIISFDFQGLDEEGFPIIPTNEEDYAPGTPTITKIWVDWEDYSDCSSTWDDMIGGKICVEWKDAPSTVGYVDKWVLSFKNLNDYNSEGESTLYAWQATKKPESKKGLGMYAPTYSISAEDGAYGELGHTVKVNVTASNNTGSSTSNEGSIVVTSFPRFRAQAGNKCVLLEWTDLFNDTETTVNSWEIWRKSESGLWENIKTLQADTLEYAQGQDKNGTKNYEWKDTDVSNSWKYQYKVVAKCADGLDRASVIRKVTPTWSASIKEPGAPRNLTYNVVNGEVTFKWDKPTTGEVEKYQLVYEMKYGNDTYWVEADSVSASSTSLVWSQTNAGTYRCFLYAYSYINGEKKPEGANVWETNDIDLLYPNHSNIVNVTLTEAQVAQQANTAPGKFNLTATGGENQITLNWTASSGATSFVIKRFSYQDNDSADFPYVNVSGSTRSYVDRTVIPGVFYTYEVDAVNIYGSSYQLADGMATGVSKDEMIASNVSSQIMNTVFPGASSITEENAESYEKQFEDIINNYEGLTKAQKRLLKDEASQKIEDFLDAIKAAKVAAKYRAVVASFKEVTDSLPAVSDITIENWSEYEAQIKAARSSYNRIPKDAKVLVKAELARIVACEDRLAEIKVELEQKMEADRVAAQAVTELIAKLSTDADTLDKAKIVEARTAYDNLNTQAKSMVSEEALNKLVACENLLEVKERTEAEIAQKEEEIRRVQEEINKKLNGEEGESDLTLEQLYDNLESLQNELEQMKNSASQQIDDAQSAADEAADKLDDITFKPTDISKWKVALNKTSFTYNKKAQKPSVVSIGNKKLVVGTDYTINWSNSSSKNVGTYTVTVTGKGKYTGTTKATYKINKAKNTMTVKAKTATVKYSKIKKKKALLKTSSIMTIKKAEGKKTFTKKSGSKSITVNKTTGKVTVKKGLKKGTYKIKVKVKAAGNSNYSSVTKTITFKVKVK